MTIPHVQHSSGISADPHKQPNAIQQSNQAAAAAAGKEQFNKVLDHIAGAIVSPEESAKKQRTKRKKQEQIEDGKGMKREEDEPILQQVRRVKSRLKDIAKYEQNQLGL